MLLADMKGKETLILGFGREGQDSFLFLRKKFPTKMLGIADKKEFEEFSSEIRELLNKDRKVVLYLGQDYLKSLAKYDIIIKAPGIPLKVLKPFQSKKQIITSQTNIFFAHCAGTIIGVTGTKGKSTTSAMIYEVLRSGGVKVHLIGNIEKPVLGFLDTATKNDVFVYELSSFQLETITKSPHIAIFLNLYPEHLDHHGTLKNYTRAKENITKFQTKDDYLIFNRNDPSVSAIAMKSKAHKISFQTKEKRGTLIAASEEPAILVGKLFHISTRNAQKVLRKFKPLPHRLEPVSTWREITFYNDSLATIPEATIAALDILGKNVHTLILGGYDRGIPFEKLAQRILKSNVQTLILFPTTGNTIFKEIEALNEKDFPEHFFVNNMSTAVQLCYEHTLKGKICLLSPASSSFNLFSDYKQRGEEFKKFVALYGKKKRS